MLAEVTNNRSQMTQISNTKFFLNRTLLVRDSNIIRRAQTTAGFSVHILKRDPPKKKKRKVIRDENGDVKRSKKVRTTKKTAHRNT